MAISIDARVLLTCALFALGCGDGGDDARDGGRTGDSAVAADGDVTADLCEATMATAASTSGCNGGYSSDPVANAPGGQCTPGTDTMPSGSCTTERAICMGAASGAPGVGWCVVGCGPPTAYVEASTCPTGFRCFRLGTGEDAFGLCYRDCDATHPCAEGWTCSAENRCEETP